MPIIYKGGSLYLQFGNTLNRQQDQQSLRSTLLTLQNARFLQSLGFQMHKNLISNIRNGSGRNERARADMRRRYDHQI